MNLYNCSNVTYSLILTIIVYIEYIQGKNTDLGNF